MLIFIALIAAGIVTGQKVVIAATDTTAPVFKGISIDKSSAASGEKVTFSVNASDISGINYTFVEYVSPSGSHTYYSFMFSDENGVLKELFPVSSDTETGIWKPVYIAIADNAGNTTEVFNNELYTQGNLMNLSTGNFEVLKTQYLPTGLRDYAPTNYGGSDGKITGTTTLMEYKLSTDSNYKPVTGSEITGLTAGTYYVRYKSKPGYAVSMDLIIVLVTPNGQDFVVSNGVLTKYYGSGGDVVIPDNLGITRIGEEAFYQNFSVNSVTIPEGVTSIGYMAFEQCSMNNVHLPESLSSIERSAFMECHSLTSITIPSGVTNIGESAFAYSSLKSINLPDGLKSLGGGAFQATSLTSAYIPDNITEIPDFTFYDCHQLTNVTMPKDLTRIGIYAFGSCYTLNDIVIPSSVTSIGSYAFGDCQALKSITAYPIIAPNIGDYVFIGDTHVVLYTLPETFGYDISLWNSIPHNKIAPSALKVYAPPLKTEYYTGQNLNLTGIIVLALYGDSYLEQVPVTAANISGFNSSSPATGQKVTVTFDGKAATFDVNITDKAFAPQSTGNMALGKTITSSSAFKNGVYDYVNSACATDGSVDSISYADLTNPGLQWVQLDLGETKDLCEINLWHYFGDSLYVPPIARAYHDVIVQLSDDPTFATGVTTVYNNDRDNSANLGAGTDFEYTETSAGLNIAFNAAKARYVRIYSNGSTANAYNHYSEIEIYGYMPIVPIEVSVPPKKTIYTVGQSLNLTGIVVTGTFEGGMKAPIAITGENISGFDSSTPVEGQDVTVTVGGKTATFKVDIIAQPAEMYQSNLAAGKLFTSPVFKMLELITDGRKTTGYSGYSEDSPSNGLQYVQLDLGKACDINEFKLWHYFGDARKYRDVIVQISDDPTFATGVKTVFNNDTDNSAKLGTGTDLEYSETSAGLDIEFNTVNGRYLRFYSNGSSVNPYNHYVEIEVYGLLPVVHPDIVSLSKTSAQVETGATFTLTANVLPTETTNKSVTWSSSDTSVATVSSAGVVTGLKVGSAVITATTVDGSYKAECTITVTEPVGNLASGKAVTASSGGYTNLYSATDGYKGTDQFTGSIDSGLSWIQLDMGASLDVNHVNLWHYFGDGRTYHDVIVQFSDDPTFATGVTTVYNNDKDNTAGKGIGADSEYAETSAGKSIDFTAVKARYARIYSNGSTANGWNHVVEVEISKEVQRTNYAKGAAATTSSSFKNLNVATDNSVNTGYADGCSGLHWVQYDLGSVQDINEINLWHYFLDGRTYHDVIVQVSNDPTFATSVKTVYSNDTNNSAGLGIGKDTEYAETSAGKSITFATEKAEYVRLYSNGSSINTYNHYVEVEICNNLASGLLATSSPGFTSLNVINDGLKTGYANGPTGLQWIQYDLGSVKDINEVNLWHYYLDGRTYHDVIVQVSSDPTFATGVTTVYNNDTNNSALLGAGSDSEYAETAAGKKITFSTKKAQYVRIYSNGSSINAYNHYVEVEICNNLAAGKTAAVTSSAFTNMGSLTDGNKSAGYAEGLMSGLQWVQLDLGAAKSINRINLLHYFLDGRTYHDVIVQVSNDSTFSTGVKTVFNNDKDNSAGFGAGSDSEYAETSAGRTIDFTAVDAQYVRIYSNGSTANGWNHIVEVEVLGN